MHICMHNFMLILIAHVSSTQNASMLGDCDRKNVPNRFRPINCGNKTSLLLLYYSKSSDPIYYTNPKHMLYVQDKVFLNCFTIDTYYIHFLIWLLF